MFSQNAEGAGDLEDQKGNYIICQGGIIRATHEVSSQAWARVTLLCEMLASSSICLKSTPFQMVKDVGENCNIQNNGPEIQVLVWVSQRQQRNLRGLSVSVSAWC